MEELVAETKKMHQKLIHLAQEAEDAEKQRDRMCNWVLDLKVQKYDVQKELWKLEQDLNGKKEDAGMAWGQEKRVGSYWSKGSNSHTQCFRVVSGWCFSWAKGTKKEKG